MEKDKGESSERSFGESESVSSLPELQPEGTLESHDEDIQSPEVEPKDEDLNDCVRTLTEKLSAALANVSAKDDLVKQHVKVAEEAVAGWEKAENEVIELKKKLEVADDKNRVLEDRVSHLDGALKECVKQLRQARDEQEERIQDAVIERTQELQCSKASLENQILESETKFEELSQMVESVARENVMLRHELVARCEELEIRTIERDLSTKAAETASKQQLDSIKKVAKLEAECRKLRMLAKSSCSFNDHRSADSYSDGGEKMDVSCSDTWASSTLIEKRSLQGTSSSIEIDLMDDFLEMERLAALPETSGGSSKRGPASVTEEVHSENSLAAEIEVLTSRTKELEEKLEKLEAEKSELESKVKCHRDEDVTHVDNPAAEIEVLTSRTKELEEKVEKLEADKSELESKVRCNRDEDVTHADNSASEIEVLTSRTKELEEKVEKLEVEKSMLESKVKSTRDEYVTHVDSSTDEIKVLTSRTKELVEKLENLEAEKSELESEVKSNRDEAVIRVQNVLATEIEVLTSQTKELEEKLEKLEAEKDKLENDVKCNREETVIRVQNSMAAEIDVLVSQTKELEEKLEKLEAEKDELENEVRCNREEVVTHIENSLATEIKVLAGQIKQLEEKLEELEAEKDKLESEVKCKRDEAVAHVENSLSAEIEVWTSRAKKLEDKLGKLEAEKGKLENELKCNREVESTLRFELEAIACDKKELENKLEKMEVEKAELQISFDIMEDKYRESQVCLQEIETKLEEIQTEMKLANELKAEVESQIIVMEAEVKTKSEKIESLEEDMRKEKFAYDELRRKCEALEEEISLHQENTIKSKSTEPKIKQEDMETAAGKLANCQKTIASLGKQLQSLATLEDFLTDTPSISVAANGLSSSSSSSYSETWKVHKEKTYMTRPIKETLSSSSSAATAVSIPISSNQGSSEKNRNGFATVFTKSKDGIHLTI